MMVEGERESGYLGTSMKLRLGAHPASVWRSVNITFFLILSRCFICCTQILGFDASGSPVLPKTSPSADNDVLRREKMAWEEISVQAAKIISFSGKIYPR